MAYRLKRQMKPYGFCISGAIDGCSRYILWLDVDVTNNDTKLICTYFLDTVEKLGLVPRTLRIDKGTENVELMFRPYCVRMTMTIQWQSWLAVLTAIKE